MAQQNTPPAAGVPPGGEAPSQPLPIVPLLNSITLLGALGFLVYSKVLYHRPAITEDGERARLEQLNAAPTATIPALVKFDPVTINIEPNPKAPKPADGTFEQIQGKLHYITIGFSIEIRDEMKSDLIENVRPIIMDKLGVILGKRRFHELTTVQGRFTLHSQILDMINQTVSSYHHAHLREPLATQLYFTQFLVQ
jgi:Flagellar basal body-associated protein FliL